jgi:hypothetical protein
MYCAHSLINVATYSGMSNPGFHPHLVLLSTMNVYLKNTNIGEKRINKKRKSHTPLNPPSMGEYIEQFSSLEGCRLQRGECFSFVILGFHPHPHLLPHQGRRNLESSLRDLVFEVVAIS